VSQAYAVIAGRERHPPARLAGFVAHQADRMTTQPHWLVAHRSVETVISILAAFRAGAPVALINPKLSDSERTALRRDIDLSQLPGDAAVVVFTSGTAGTPKGVVLSAAAFAASSTANTEHLGWNADDRWLCCLSLAHIGGLSIVTRCTDAQRTIVLTPEQPFVASELIDAIETHRVTLLSLVPAMLSRMLDDAPDWRPPEHLRAVLLGGAKASPGLIAHARNRGLPIQTTYGMSETCSQIYTGGVLLSGVEVRTHEHGHLQVRGPMLASGYIDEQGFRPLTHSDGWFDTGDLGHVDSDGRLHISGRADDCIISGGANVIPAEVENALEASPDVSAACVFGIADETWGQVVAAAIVPASSSLADGTGKRRLAEFLRERLASYKRPRRICVINELPLGPTGKIDRRQVVALTRDRLVSW